jgi:predicted membrane-bound dolichyl-phosphate-mannose-protein mannosyltransferase
MKLSKSKYSKVKAISSNSQSSTIPIEVYDHSTETITKFHAIRAAAKGLGIDKRYIENYIFLNQKKPVLGKYTFKLLKKDFSVSKVPLVLQKTYKTIEVYP